jgi:hypothetical protein
MIVVFRQPTRAQEQHGVDKTSASVCHHSVLVRIWQTHTLSLNFLEKEATSL